MEWPVQHCHECEGRRLAFASARAAVEYDDAVRALVAAWKERGLRGLAAVAADTVVEAVERPDAAALVPVPADPERELERGHHPADALTRELAGRWGLPVVAAVRRRPGARQAGLSSPERRRNVAGVFQAITPVPRTAVLVDDVYTTGATAAAAASALRRAGAARVDVVTLARAIRGR